MLRPYKGHRLRPRDLVSRLSSTGLLMVELTMILAGAGFVIATLNVTGLGFNLTLELVQIAGGNLFLLLAIAAVICIILGMGMPTAGVYVLLAALVAPALEEVNVLPLAAHMFILYFGMMSMITPPIALSAFAAATISKASPMETGWISMRLGWVAYVIPFLFVFTPTLLLYGKPLPIVLNVTTAAIGVYFISVAAIGYFGRRLGPAMRAALLAAGIAAIFPDTLLELGGVVDGAGALIGVALLVYLRTTGARAAPVPARGREADRDG